MAGTNIIIIVSNRRALPSWSSPINIIIVSIHCALPSCSSPINNIIVFRKALPSWSSSPRTTCSVFDRKSYLSGSVAGRDLQVLTMSDCWYRRAGLMNVKAFWSPLLQSVVIYRKRFSIVVVAGLK